MKPIDALGMGPKRDLIYNDDGTFTLTVTPPEWSGGKPTSLILTAEQARGYKRWQSGALIQYAIPSLPAAQREIILTGIGPEEWKEIEQADEE
jgi:hypothetical protein